MNKILFFLIALLMLTSMSFAQVADPSHPMIQFPDGTLLSPTNPLPSTATIGSVTVDAFPVYKDAAGDPATSELDTDSNVKVNLASETIGLLTTIKTAPLSAPTINVAKVTLAAGVSTKVEDLYAASTDYKQKFVEIKALDDTAVFWISFGSAAVVEGNARPCTGRVYVEMRTQDLYVISATELDVYITRGAVESAD